MTMHSQNFVFVVGSAYMQWASSEAHSNIALSTMVLPVAHAFWGRKMKDFSTPRNRTHRDTRAFFTTLFSQHINESIGFLQSKLPYSSRIWPTYVAGWRWHRADTVRFAFFGRWQISVNHGEIQLEYGTSVASYQSKRFSSKWELPFLPLLINPSS